jgi:hypothetical protein
MRCKKLEPLAYHFVVNFAKDNDCRVLDVQRRQGDACLVLA